MRIPRLYVNQPLIIGESLSLADDRSHYLIRVLRLKPPHPLVLFNGDGCDYQADLVEINGRVAIVNIQSSAELQTESPLSIHLLVALSKGDKLDWVLQKSTELGVASIQLIQTERTDVKLSADRAEKKLAHWQGVVQSACEQSGRAVIPRILAPCRFADGLTYALAQYPEALRLIMHPGPTHSVLPKHISSQQVILVIGPEGGFSEVEISTAEQNGFLHWLLGPRVLRTETAPIAGLSALHCQFGDF